MFAVLEVRTDIMKLANKANLTNTGEILQARSEKSDRFFCVFTPIGCVPASAQGCCIGSAYRHHKAGQRGNLYLKRKWLK